MAETAECTLLMVRLARAASYRVGEALTAVGMRTQEFAVLHHLAQAGPLSQQELGAALRINPSNLVGLLDALEDDDLILRARDPGDRRRHLVGLTPEGEHRLARAKRAVEAAELDLLAPLSDDERRLLHGLLDRLAIRACSVAGARRGRAC